VPQVSLAHVMSQPLDIFVLVDCANRDEFAANVAALEMRLTSTEMAWLDLRQDEVPA
jgi:aryl-alcohol dehydrogenase-like predicted oxidoreductase